MARRYFGRVQGDDQDWWCEYVRRVEYVPKLDEYDAYPLPLIPMSEFTPNRANDELIIYEDISWDGWLLDENGVPVEPPEVG